jgi:aspartyl protease family protein
MSGFQSYHLIWLAGALVLAVSALWGTRMSLGVVVRSLIGWAAIGIIAFIAVQNRHEIGGMVAAVTERLGIDDQQVQGKTVRIRMATDGHFWARVKLNGVEKQMLIDSGATITAISDETARAAGITGTGGMPIIIETANGTVEARRATVDELSVGPLSTQDLGVVIAPNFGDFDVLGMNFLSRLKSWRVEGKTLILEPGRADGSTAEDQTAEPVEGAERRPVHAR